MSHPHYHALSSVKKYGGEYEDYLEIHNWFDQFKSAHADVRHRLVLHHSAGIFLCEQVFGVTFTRKSDSKEVPTRLIAEQHVIEDFGFIPNIGDVLEKIPLERWMSKGARKLSQELEGEVRYDGVQST